MRQQLLTDCSAIPAPRRIGATEISADVRTGDAKAALWFAIGANARNGMRLSGTDKALAITKALREFPDRSQRQIAEHVGCSPDTVSRISRQLSDVGQLDRPERTTGKDGKSYPARFWWYVSSGTTRSLTDAGIADFVLLRRRRRSCPIRPVLHGRFHEFHETLPVLARLLSARPKTRPRQRDAAGGHWRATVTRNWCAAWRSWTRGRPKGREQTWRKVAPSQTMNAPRSPPPRPPRPSLPVGPSSLRERPTPLDTRAGRVYCPG